MEKTYRWIYDEMVQQRTAGTSVSSHAHDLRPRATGLEMLGERGPGTYNRLSPLVVSVEVTSSGRCILPACLSASWDKGSR